MQLARQAAALGVGGGLGLAGAQAGVFDGGSSLVGKGQCNIGVPLCVVIGAVALNRNQADGLVLRNQRHAQPRGLVYTFAVRDHRLARANDGLMFGGQRQCCRRVTRSTQCADGIVTQRQGVVAVLHQQHSGVVELHNVL